MMKRSVVAIAISLLLGMCSAQAVEIYNKDGNKLDLNDRIKVSHVISDNSENNGDASSNIQGGFIGETKITNKLTGYGTWSYQFSLRDSEVSGSAPSSPWQQPGAAISELRTSKSLRQGSSARLNITTRPQNNLSALPSACFE